MKSSGFPEPRAAAVAFDPETSKITVDLKDGGSISFRADDEAEIRTLSMNQLAAVTTDHIGFYIVWPGVNVTLYVPALFMKYSVSSAG